MSEELGLLIKISADIEKAVTAMNQTAEATNKLASASDEASTRVSAAVYSIEAVSEDINMPMHARTQIWAILSALESIKTA